MVTGAAESAATPEVAAYLAQKEVSEKSSKTIWRRVALALGAALLVVVAVLIYVATAVGQIKSTVDSHTQQLTCQSRGYDAVLKDAKLAIEDDHNASDYAKAPKGC